MTVKILHQTEDYLVCIKPQGVESQRQLPQWLAQQCGGEFFTVHRLDKETGGVMVYAKNQKTAAFLSRQIGEGGMKKRYYAVVLGQPAEEQGQYRDLLFRDAAKNKSYVVKRQRRGVKETLLSYQVVDTWQEDGNPRSLVSIDLHTGRTHQIRVQFASRQMPVLGDRKYGGKENQGVLHLWSAQLIFQQPDGGQAVFEELPPWMTPKK